MTLIKKPESWLVYTLITKVISFSYMSTLPYTIQVEWSDSVFSKINEEEPYTYKMLHEKKISLR